jgi:hypothetical protein
MRGFLPVLKIVLLCVAMVSCASAGAQSSSDLALKNLQRQKWQRAYELLAKALAKDSLNVTANYVLAQYFFSEANPSYHLDSAYQYVLEAINDFQKTNAKQRERLRRFPVDSLDLSVLRHKIDSTAFELVKQNQSEDAWTDFINRFPISTYIPRAVELRDSVAYEDCVIQNTSDGFHEFLEKYPRARQAETARNNYEVLLLSEKTADGTLASYETFLAEYPDSPHRRSVEQTIFEYRTASGLHQDFVDFIRNYAHNPFIKKARNILFHLIPESERANLWPMEFTTDSLAQVLRLQSGYLVPFLKNNKYGFMDAEGNEIISPTLDSINSSYTCGNIDGDVISLPDKLVSNTGASVWDGRMQAMEDLGFGFLFIESQACKFIIHKSGFRIDERCVDEAKMLNGRFVAIKHGNQWSLYSLSGRLLLQGVDDVYCIQDVICIKRNERVQLLQARGLGMLPAKQREVAVEYDDAQPWGKDMILVTRQTQTALLDQSLNTAVPFDDHVLTQSFFGTISSHPLGIRIYSSSQGPHEFDNIISRDPWLAAKDSLWRLIDPKTFEHLTSPYDTIIFAGPFPIAYHGDSTFIFFSPTKLWKGIPSAIEFVPGKVSAPYLWIDQRGRKSLFSHEGQKLFSVTCDKIHYAGQDLFVVQKKDKRGLMSSTGKLVLPIEYDGIGTVNNGTISLLKATKFGLFDCVSRKLIPAAYTKNLTPYNHRVISAFKNGLYGFIGWDNKVISKFEFKEIHYWNDTTALAKKDSHWILYEIKTGKVLLDKIKDYRLVANVEGEKLAIIYQGTDHGVIHSRRGIIIPIAYSDIVNVGSAAKPLFFTEKHLEEASVFVVIYYDNNGQILRKEMYDQEAYDRIYCHAD